jgi:hypothetical protein
MRVVDLTEFICNRIAVSRVLGARWMGWLSKGRVANVEGGIANWRDL